MSSTLIKGILGGVAGGASAQLQKIRDEAEQKRKVSFAKIMQEFQQQNAEFVNKLAMKRDEKGYEFKDKLTDKKFKQDKEVAGIKNKGLLEAASAKNAGTVIGFARNGSPVTPSTYKEGMEIFKDPPKRGGDQKPLTLDQVKASIVQTKLTDDEQRGLVLNEGQKPDLNPTQAKKEIARVTAAIGKLKSKSSLSSGEMGELLKENPVLAAFLGDTKEMSQEDLDRAVLAMEQYLKHLQQFVGGGIVSPQEEEPGEDEEARKFLQSVLGK